MSLEKKHFEIYDTRLEEKISDVWAVSEADALNKFLYREGERGSVEKGPIAERPKIAYRTIAVPAGQNPFWKPYQPRWHYRAGFLEKIDAKEE